VKILTQSLSNIVVTIKKGPSRIRPINTKVVGWWRCHEFGGALCLQLPPAPFLEGSINCPHTVSAHVIPHNWGLSVSCPVHLTRVSTPEWWIGSNTERLKW
jgi:hypothetical protein